MAEQRTDDPKMHEGTLEEDGAHCNSADCWCWEDRYMVVMRDSWSDLAQAVNAYIHQKGWKPLGGVSRTENESNVIWSQAMTRHL